MRRRPSFLVLTLLILLASTLTFAQDSLREVYPLDDFTLREDMVPMRDGVKLYTVILIPKNAAEPLPIIFERTPYDATRLKGASSTRLEVTLGPKFLGNGYIYAAQDLRGRYKSEGKYEMYRVPRGEYNQTDTDETTDAWDAIDWLVKNLPGNNGKVGVWGTSYPGWLTLSAMRKPHPALAAAVPFNPVVDVWKADDWFHWGAFRPIYAFDFIYSMETRKGTSFDFPYHHRDLYTWALDKGALGKALGTYLDERHEMWGHLMENPSYTGYWRDCAADQWFDHPSRLVPALHVHGLWDQEDIYGSPAAYAALEKHDSSNDLNFFAAGPWYHGQHFADGSQLGRIRFDEDTAKRFREDVLCPFLDHFLKGVGALPIKPVVVFETGANRWRHFDQWPPTRTVKKLYLQAGGKLSFAAPKDTAAATEYISDPAKPVPNAPRPVWGFNYGVPSIISKWRTWLVEDQRFADGRPDVATWVSEPIQAPLTVRGPVLVKLFAETTGTDADWVVKLIDVYPDEDPGSFEMSGFQLMISADIFRGRYREDYAKAQALKPNEALAYTIPLPTVNHTFKSGHRLMVQVQSTWFPLYDRNPQTFVDSIMNAPDSSFRAQKHCIHHSAASPTHLELLVDSENWAWGRSRL